MMKTKIILLALFILAVLFTSVSCKENSDLNSTNSSSQTIGSYNFDLQKLKNEATYNGDVIVNAESAKQYANIVLKETLGKDLNDFKEITVMLDSNNNVWVINYGVDEETLGGDISVVISQKTGELLKVWFGE